MPGKAHCHGVFDTRCRNYDLIAYYFSICFDESVAFLVDHRKVIWCRTIACFQAAAVVKAQVNFVAFDLHRTVERT